MEFLRSKEKYRIRYNDGHLSPKKFHRKEHEEGAEEASRRVYPATLEPARPC